MANVTSVGMIPEGPLTITGTPMARSWESQSIGQAHDGRKDESSPSSPSSEG